MPNKAIEAICAAALEIKSVEKDGTNAFHGYKYATEAAVVEACRNGLLSRGVVLTMDALRTDVRERNTKSGINFITTIEFEARFEHWESGDKLIFKVIGCGDDAADKGAAKATTGAKKSALVQAFLLVLGDDPEADHRTDEAATTKRAASSPAPDPGDHWESGWETDAEQLRADVFSAIKESISTLRPKYGDLLAKGIAGSGPRGKLFSDVLGKKISGLPGVDLHDMPFLAQKIRELGAGSMGFEK